MKHVVVYSLATGRHRRTILLDTEAPDAQLLGTANLQPGEGVTLVESGLPPGDRRATLQLPDWQAAACRATGKRPTPLHPECAAKLDGLQLEEVHDLYDIVHEDSGAVVGCAHLDPAVDGYPGHRLVKHA